MFAVYEAGGPIYAVGATARQAITEALQWLDGTKRRDIQAPHGERDIPGRLYVRPCSPAIARHAIQDDTGTLPYCIDHATGTLTERHEEKNPSCHLPLP